MPRARVWMPPCGRAENFDELRAELVRQRAVAAAAPAASTSVSTSVSKAGGHEGLGGVKKAAASVARRAPSARGKEN